MQNMLSKKCRKTAEEQKRINKIRLVAGRIVTAAISLIIVVLLGLVVYLFWCNLNSKPAFIGKYAVLRILTPSMEDTIPTGSYILIERANADDIKVKDIITFESTDPEIIGRLNTHRVSGFDENGDFLTKGDNAADEDEYPALRENLIGRYVKNIALLTNIANLLQNGFLFIMLILLPSTILIGSCTLDLIKKAKQAKFEMAVEAEVNRMLEADKSRMEDENNVQKTETEKRDSQADEADRDG